MADSRKRASETEAEGAPQPQRQASAAAGGESSAAAVPAAEAPPTGAAALEFPSSDFSQWALDTASGWFRSPDGAWSYNSATFIFFHGATGGYYMYDGAQQSYVGVQVEGGDDGQLRVVAPEAERAPESARPAYSLAVDGATMQGRRQKQEDRHTIIADCTAELAAAGCAAAPPLPASFFGVYDGHAGHDTSEFVAEQLHKDIFTSLAAQQAIATGPGGDTWADALVLAAIKEGYAKTDQTFCNWARPRRRKDGSTAVTALLLGSKLYVGWVGDSRGMVISAAGEDHKQVTKDEFCIKTRHFVSKTMNFAGN